MIATHRGGGWIAALLVVIAGAGCARDESEPPAPQDGPASPARTAWFDERAAAAGLDFTYESGHRERYLFPEIVGGGGALFDMDGDGDLDAYLVQGGGITTPPDQRPPNRLFSNRGDGNFEDVTAGSGAGDRGYGMGVAAGDYDDDGDVDLYITNVGSNVLLRNDGAGRFTDVTNEAGVGHDGWGSSAAFVDVDADGRLDLFVVNYVRWSLQSDRICHDDAGVPDYCSPTNYDPAPDVLYRNLGDGRFEDVSIDAGLRTAFGNGLGIVCADVDRDGRVDIFVTNDKLPNQLWMNQGSFSFRDEALLRGCGLDLSGQAKAGMGAAASDVTGNGWPDLLAVNLQTEADELFLNDGGLFRDGAPSAGLAMTTRAFTRFGVGWIDLDHDGWLDQYVANGRVVRGIQEPIDPDDAFAEPNLLLVGGPGPRWTPVEPAGGTNEPLVATSRAAVFGDVNGDGAVDVLVVNRDRPAHLLVNRPRPGRHWMMLRVLAASGRDAYGATITLRAGEREIVREVRSAYSYLAANDPRIHVGLGRVDAVPEVTVRWPDGLEERFDDIEVDTVVTLRRGVGVPPR